ncbi:DUF7289 family protein [Halovivax gelatinilyticus]|uniref:DUF7289 family protein n=1 Tax=Halovivax gelatinilyticus TaxID=2961597 RepID=UPI0020CA5F0C|nr:hypothetical protein [Halovivax gelatinilyticus]
MIRSDGRSTDRGVSEVVGFVIVFGLIIASVGVLYMTGFQAMGDFQQSEQQNNADFAMDALAENFNDIVRNDGVLERSGELNLREGTIQVESDGSIKHINVTKDGSDTDVLDDHLSNYDHDGIGAFTYEYEGTTVAYQGGAVVKVTPSGEITVRDPPMRCVDGVAVVSLVVVDGDERSLMAHGSQEVTANKIGTSVYQGSNVTIELGDSEYTQAWERSLESLGLKDKNECDQEHAVVRITSVDISYD